MILVLALINSFTFYIVLLCHGIHCLTFRDIHIVKIMTKHVWLQVVGSMERNASTALAKPIKKEKRFVSHKRSTLLAFSVCLNKVLADRFMLYVAER